jgi:hypothetical protein
LVGNATVGSTGLAAMNMITIAIVHSDMFLVVPIQKSANLVEIKAREKFNRRHMVDIPRIHFSRNADIYPPSAGRANWSFMDRH